MRPSEIARMKRVAATERGSKRRLAESCGEAVLSLLLHRKPPSTYPLLVTRGLLNKAKELGLKIQVGYEFVQQSNVDYCLSIGLDPYDVVPAALLNSPEFCQWAVLRFPRLPSISIYSRAAAIGASRLPRDLPPEAKTKSAFESESFPALVRANRLDLIIGQRYGKYLAKALVLHSKSNDARAWSLVARSENLWADWVMDNLRSTFLKLAAKFGRFDILQWAATQSSYNCAFDSALFVKSIKAGREEISRWLLLRDDKLGDVFPPLIEHDCLELFQLAANNRSLTIQHLTQAVSLGRLRIAVWLREHLNVDLTQFGLHQLCRSAEGMAWLIAHGWPSDRDINVECQLQTALANGQVALAQSLFARIKPKVWYLLSASWHDALLTLIRLPLGTCPAQASAELVRMVLSMTRLREIFQSDRALIIEAAKLGRFDLARTLRLKNAQWYAPYWAAVVQGSAVDEAGALDFLRAARRSGRLSKLTDYKCRTALLGCRNDAVWAFSLDELAVPLDWAFESTKYQCPERFLWLVDRHIAHVQGQMLGCWRVTPALRRWCEVGGALHAQTLIDALLFGDRQLEHLYTKRTFGFQVTVNLEDELRFAVQLQDQSLAWSWPIQASWTTLVAAKRARLAAGGYALELQPSRNAAPFASKEATPPTCDPLLRLADQEFVCNQENHYDMIYRLLVEHLVRLARVSRDPRLGNLEQCCDKLLKRLESCRINKLSAGSHPCWRARNRA